MSEASISHQILITGASSGIGEALAEHYAATLGASVFLGLVARREERLAALAARLESHGARVRTYTADVRDAERMAEVGRDFTGAAGGISLAIANAGVSLGDRLWEGNATPGTDTIGINVQGVINTLAPLVPLMIEQRHGHLVTIGSVAGFRGLPGKGAYCASKAAVKVLMDSYRPVLKSHGVRVTTICPGWVVSELSGNNAHRMPLMVETPEAARRIATAIRKGRRTYIFPWQVRIAVPIMKILPDWMLPNLRKKQ